MHKHRAEAPEAAPAPAEQSGWLLSRGCRAGELHGSWPEPSDRGAAVWAGSRRSALNASDAGGQRGKPLRSTCPQAEKSSGIKHGVTRWLWDNAEDNPRE